MNDTVALVTNIIGISTILTGLGTMIASGFVLSECLIPAGVFFTALGGYGEFELHTDRLVVAGAWAFCALCVLSVTGFFGVVLVAWHRSGAQRRSMAG